MFADIFITTLIAVLTLISQHYFPWRLALKRDLPRTAAYTMGTAALVVPLAVLYASWAIHPPAWGFAFLAALLSVTIFGGMTVFSIYALDSVMIKFAQADEITDLYVMARKNAKG